MVLLVAWATCRERPEHRCDRLGRASAQGPVQVSSRLGRRVLAPARLAGRRLIGRQVAVRGSRAHPWAYQQYPSNQVRALPSDPGGEAAAVGRPRQQDGALEVAVDPTADGVQDRLGVGGGALARSVPVPGQIQLHLTQAQPPCQGRGECCRGRHSTHSQHRQAHDGDAGAADVTRHQNHSGSK